MASPELNLEIPSRLAEREDMSLLPMVRRIEKFEGNNGTPAGKRAAKKAITDLIPFQVDENQLRIIKKPSGEPAAEYDEQLYSQLLAHGIFDIPFSITHFDGIALAFALTDRIDFDWLKIGVDLTSEERMRRFVGKRNILRFTPEELEEANESPTSIACRFSVKESVSKALGTGFSQGILGTDIHTTEEDGQVSIALTGEAQTRAHELGLNTWEIAIAHEGALVASYVIAHS